MFKKVISVVLASALISSVFAFPAQAVTASTPTKSLVSSAWLKENIADKKLVILHVGDADNSVYVRGHIEGAQYLDWKTELANASESKLRNGVVVQSKFQQVVKRLGIDTDSTVVLYAEGKSGLKATWGSWVFNLYGFQDVRILDGGLLKWVAAGNATTFTVPAAKPAGNFVTTNDSRNLRAKITEVISNAQSKSAKRAIIVDTRDSASFAGTNTSTGLGNAANAGHIASAKSIPTASILNADGTFKSVADIKAAYAAVGVTSSSKVLLYCGTGLLASASWFALTQILGYKNVKNYDGSWFEFSAQAPKTLIDNPAVTASK
jgi:thiosulfate/3-mercaptopyruvate sulfurtransferase